MSFNANERGSGGTPQEALEPTAYPARVVQLVIMGLQNQKPYNGQDKPPKEELHVTYELSHEFMKDDEGNDKLDKPRWISETFPFYNLGADRATSTLRYQAIDQQGQAGGDWIKLLGMPCSITLTKEPKKGQTGVFTNYVSSVSPISNMPGYTQPELVNPTKVFDIDEPDMEVFKGMPDWMKKKLSSNLNFNGSKLQEALGLVSQDTPTPEPQASAPAPSAPPVPSAPPAPPQADAS